MKRYTTISCFCCLILFSATIVYGQGFTGPGANTGSSRQTSAFFEPIPVSQARTLPKDSWVVLSGNIVNTLPGGKYYTFRDSSPSNEGGGEITVEIEPKVWRGLSVEPSDRVVISGEVEVKKGQVSIDVKAVSGAGRMNARQGQAVTITKPITVNEVKNLPNNSWVILAGNIVNNVGKGKYTFRDSAASIEGSPSKEGGGEIVVEIDKKTWRGLSVNASDRVEIHGKLEIKRGQFSIEVEAIRGL